MEQGSAEWFNARLGKVTASRLSDVMMKPTSAGWIKYKAQLIGERLNGTPPESFSNAAMAWGTDKEPEARAAYEFIHDCTVDEIGFIDHPVIRWAGASPDGLIGEYGMLEIKCPNSETHIATLEGGKIPSKYIYQMQWQMACSERKWCDFASYDPRMRVEMQLHVVRIDRDDELISKLESSACDFLAKVQTSVDYLNAKFMKDEI